MTDLELIEQLAARVMLWPAYDVSHHRPGARPLPHVWKWKRAAGVKLMVYDGKTNREWNPLTTSADAAELSEAIGMRGHAVPPAPTEAPAFREWCLDVVVTFHADAMTDEPQPESQNV
jgi:hypothetical protein